MNKLKYSHHLFYQTLGKLSRAGAIPIIVIAGNHDSPDHIQAPDALARQLGIILIGYPRQPGLNYTSSTGQCPKCNMDLQKVEEMHEHHEHDSTHTNH